MAINNQVVKDYTKKLYLTEEVKEVNSNLKETYKLLKDFEIKAHNYLIRIGAPQEIIKNTL